MIVTHYVVAIFALGISLGPYPVVASANEYAALLVSLINHVVVASDL